MSDEIEDDPYEPEVVPLITVEALGRWVRQPIEGDEVDYAMVMLEGVSSYVRGEVGKTYLDPEDPTDQTLLTVPQEIRTLVMQLAGRIWRNSEGVIQETTGPFTVRWAEKIAEGLYLTEAEERIVNRHKSGVKSGLFSMPVTMGDYALSDLKEETDPYDEGWPG
jgi:hypothetical protein